MYQVRKATQGQGKKSISKPATCTNRQKLERYLGYYGIELETLSEDLTQKIELGSWPAVLPSPIPNVEIYVTRILKVDGGPKLTKEKISMLNPK